MNELDEDVPANRILDQWTGALDDRRGNVLVTQYGDGSLQVAWRPNSWSTWGPPADLRQA